MWKSLFVLVIIMCTRAYSFSFCNKIDRTRRKIDFVDDRMCDLLSVRFRLCKNIKKFKKTYLIQDKAREIAIKNRLKAKFPYLNEQLIENIWEDIFFESKRLQSLYEE